MKFILFIAGICLCIACSGQDRVAVYFKTGHSKIDEKLSHEIDALSHKYDLLDLDSVIFIGYSDSVGNYKSNLKLSEKRSKNVASYFGKNIPANIPASVRSEGEKNKQIENKDRRVDIVLYFKPSTETELEKPLLIDSVKAKNCYYINYALLAQSQKRNVIKGKKEFISLETPFLPDKSIPNYYGTQNEKGEIVPHKIKWSQRVVRVPKKKSKTIYQTLIPSDGFNRYRIFLIGKEPCKACNERFDEDGARKAPDSCVVFDRLVSPSIEIKRSSFRKSFVEMRIPASSLDSIANYFLNLDPKQKIHWKQGKGRKNRDYYFAKVPVDPKKRGYSSFQYLGYMYKKVECCLLPPPPPHDYQPTTVGGSDFHCGFKGDSDRGIVIGLEAGNNYQQHVSNQYGGIFIYIESDKAHVGLLAGMDINKKFYSAIRYQYHYFTFEYSDLNPFYSWRSPSYTPPSEKLFGRFYLGAELKKGKTDLNQQFFENNVHAGFATIYNGKIYLRGFVQYGAGFDYLRNNSQRPYPVFQLGLAWYFIAF